MITSYNPWRNWLKPNRTREPYAYLFSAGLFSALFSMGFWPLFSFHLIGFFPNEAHANTMIYGFFWAFVCGFLQTAVPRMTSTPQASRVEIALPIALVFSQLLLGGFNLSQVSRVVALVQVAALGFFLFQRLRAAKKMPFDGFVFLPFALVCFLSGNLVLLFQPTEVRLGYLLLSEGFLLNLVVGIGSRLFPVLMRIPNAVSPDQVTKLTERSRWTFFVLEAIILNLSYLIYAFGFERTSLLLRLVFLAYIAVKNLKLFGQPETPTALGVSLKLGLVALCSGLVSLLFDWNHLSQLHLGYIGGFMLITLMVATRVTLSHGGVGLQKEIGAWPLFAVTALILLAAIARVAMFGNLASSWLSSSVVLLISAVILWVLNIGKTMLVLKS